MIGNDGKSAPFADKPFPGFDFGPAVAAHTQAAGAGRFTTANRALGWEYDGEQAVSQLLEEGTRMRN